MKFLQFFFAVSLVASGVTATATVHRVNNQPGVDADFNNAATAISNAAVDDTLYFEGSPISYGDMVLNKRLVIIGTGYFLTDNDSTQAIPASSRFTRLTVSSSASGSVITGIQVENTSSSTSDNTSDMVTIGSSAHDVQLIRCYFRHLVPSSSGTSFSGATLYIVNSNNVVVSQCFIRQDRVTTGTSGSYNVRAVEVAGTCNGLVLANNIVKLGNKTSVYDWSTQRALSLQTTCNATIVNNVFMGRLEVYNSIFANNIQIIGSNTPSSSFIQNASFPNTVQNNIGNSTQFGTTNGNQSDVLMTNVFTYAPGNENVDNHYRLVAGSPAIGAGVSGVDCGAFGTDGGYKLSGMPAIPAVFEATVPAIGNNVDGIDIIIKSKSHN